MAAALPKKLKHDSIVEAVLEVRFDASDIPELIVGKLAAHSSWEKFPAQQLPAANIPAQMRRMDPNMSYLATLERRPEDGSRIVRFGERVLSYHCLAPYPDWPKFGDELFALVDILFAANLANFQISRFGLRYINAFTEKAHGVRGVSDLSLTVQVGNQTLAVSFIIAFQRQYPPTTEASVSVSSRELVYNAQPDEQTALVDIDVHTISGFTCSDRTKARSWIEDAHRFLKQEYFALYTAEMRARLIEA